MTFLAHAIRLTRDQMTSYILAIPKTGFKLNPRTGEIWSPIGVYWHNTGNPSLALYDGYSDTARTNWPDNLNRYYAGMGWHAGPHFCGGPDDGIVLGDPLADGIHCTCGNEKYFGVETILNAVPGGDDPKTGRGLSSMLSSANIIASLCVRFNWDPHVAIKFHRQCAADHHACPGVLVSDDWAIGLTVARMAEIKGAPAVVTTEPLPPTIEDIQRLLNAKGFGPLVVDGDAGPATLAAMKKALS